MTFPAPVMRNRFLAPLCVLFFGMAAVLSSWSGAPWWPRAVGTAARTGGRWRTARRGGRSARPAPDVVRRSGPTPARKPALDGHRASRVGASDLWCLVPADLDASPGVHRHAAGLVGAAPALLRPGLRLLLVRADHHDHVSAVLLRVALDVPELGDVRRHPLQQP